MHVLPRVARRRSDRGRVAGRRPRAGACRRSRIPTAGATTEYVDGALSMPFLKRRRGKRSVALDITPSRGRTPRRARSPTRADVFVENSRPGAMDGFGLGYDAARGAQPAARVLRDLRLRARRARPTARDGQHRAGRVGRDGQDRVRRRPAVARGHHDRRPLHRDIRRARDRRRAAPARRDGSRPARRRRDARRARPRSCGTSRSTTTRRSGCPCAPATPTRAARRSTRTAAPTAGSP